MHLVSKICLIIAAFFALSSIAWAGFNYESLSNSFVIDSVFKSGGNYIMVGNSLDNSLYPAGATKVSAFFGVTNNLIFLNPEAKFCTISNSTDNTCTGSRQIQKTDGEYIFKTKSVSVNSSNDFGLYPKPGSATLFLEAQTIETQSDLYLNQGRNYGSLNLSNNAKPLINSIYAPRVSANELRLFPGANQYINISSGTTLSLISSIRPRYKRTITIQNNTGQVLTDVSVAINLPADILVADKMRADGWDLRFFADSNLTVPLEFFIDIMPKIWVKLPTTISIPAGQPGDIYVTYGGKVTTNPSNPPGVFGTILGADNNAALAVSYNFDEDATIAGNTTFESSLFGPSAALKDNTASAPMRVSGRVINGIKTTGTQVVSLSPWAIPLQSEWTIETWFMTPLNTPLHGYQILARGSTDIVIAAKSYAGGYFLGTIQNPGNNFNLGWTPCDTNLSLAGDQGLNLKNTQYFTANTWHHLLAVGKDGTTTFYIDGTPAIGGKTCVAAFQSRNNVIHMGNYETGGFSWGTFDEFRVYNTALNEAQIDKLAANCGFTTLAFPGKVLVRKCLTPEPIITWGSTETCLQDCNNEALQSSLVTTAQSITYSVGTLSKNFCYVESLDTTGTGSNALNFVNFTATTANKTDKTRDDPADTCGVGVTTIGDCKMTSDKTTCARRACCASGYYVFDFNASANSNQTMVCCRYNNAAPCSVNTDCASGLKCADGSCIPT